MLHVQGFLKFLNGEGNGKLEGYSAGQCDFEDLQRCANSRWLTDGSDHSSNYNFSVWSDDDLSILCYFLAAIPSLKVS